MRETVGVTVVISALALAGLLLAEYVAVAPWGTAILLTPMLLLVIPALAAAFVVMVAPIFLIFQCTRRTALVWFSCAGIFLAAVVVGITGGRYVRMREFEKLAARSAPLVQAIDAYARQHGQPPESLDALVPEFLTAVPGTGMGAYPTYEYETGYRAAHYNGNPWVLWVSTPSGFPNFDQFLYFPRQNYPEHGYGGWLERIGDWAYVHE